MLAVGREGHVARLQGPARADLRGLLAEQRGPDAQFALALQGDRLEVDPADEDQVPVQPLDLLGGDLERVIRMLGPLSLRSQKLNELV